MDALTLIIGNKNYSSWSMRPWLAMRAGKIAFQEIVIPLRHETTAAAIAQHSPSGKVPVMKHGEIVVWESLAIIEYVAELVPEAGLWPKQAAARALARSVSAEMHAGFAALRKHLPMNVRARIPRLGLPEDVRADIARICEIWRHCRAHYGSGGRFLFGSFSAADAMFAPVVARFNTYGTVLPGDAQTYCAAVLSHPAVVAWFEQAHAEPWVIAEYDSL